MLVLAASGGAQQGLSVAELAAQASRAEAEKDYAAALATTRRLEALLPDSPAVQRQIARQAALAGRVDEAAAALAALVRLGGGVDTGKPPFAPLLTGRPEAARAALNARDDGRARAAFTLATPGLVVEGMAIDPRSGALLFADMHRHRLVRRTPDGRESSTALPAGIAYSLGLKADGPRRRLWQCAARRTGGTARATLLLLDLDTLAVQREIAFPADGKHLCNDMDVLPDGRVVVTDSDGGRLWLAAADGSLTPLTPAAGFVYPNGVAVSRDGAHAYVATSAGLHRVALADGVVTRLSLADGQSTAGIDGLYRVGRTLVGIQNGMVPMRVIAVDLDAQGQLARLRTLARASPLFALPTTGAIKDGQLLLVANAQFRAIEDDGTLKAGQTIAPTRVVAVPLSSR